MICHVGAGKLIKDGNIVGIFDLDGEMTTKATAEFLKNAEKGGRTTTASFDIPRAFVLVSDGKKEEVIFTRLTVSSVAKRAETGITGEE